MHFTELANHYLPYAQKRMGFNKEPIINFIEDEENAANPLGKTGHYNPTTMEIVVYTSGRHPKDVLRSLSHELVHHAQNCRGDLTSQKIGEVGDNYAQTNMHLRNMEREAYDLGNMYFRDWCDSHKGKPIMEKVEKQSQPLNEWLNDERFGLLMKKFGILSEAKKMPMKQDADDADGDGNTTEKVPAFLDKGDAKKKKTSGKVPPQLQKYVKSKQDKSKKDLEEKKMSKAEKKEEEKLGKEMGKAKVKSKMQKQYGKEKGEEIYYKTKRKKAMENA
jgi:hypothetical protein